MRGPRLRAPLILGTKVCTSRSQKQNAAAECSSSRLF